MTLHECRGFNPQYDRRYTACPGCLRHGCRKWFPNYLPVPVSPVVSDEEVCRQCWAELMVANVKH